MQKRDFLRKNVNAVNLDELMYELRCTTTTLTAVHWSGTQTLVTPKGRETFRLLCLKTA